MGLFTRAQKISTLTFNNICSSQDTQRCAWLEYNNNNQHSELHRIVSSLLKNAEPVLQAAGSAGHAESVTRVPYKYTVDKFYTVDFISLSQDASSSNKVYFETTWLLSSGLAIACQPSTHSAWWRQVRRKLRNNEDVVQHSVNYLPRRAVQFRSEPTVYHVERFGMAEIVGECREPGGDNPCFYHLAQCRVRRLERFQEALQN